MGNAAREKLSQSPEMVTLNLIQITFCSESVTVSTDLVKGYIEEHQEHHSSFKTPMCEVKIEPVQISGFREKGGGIT